MYVPGAINARVSENHLKVGGMNSRGTRWLDAATVGRVNAKLFIQARYQSDKQKKAVLNRVAKMNDVIRTYRELYSTADSEDDSSDDDDYHELAEKRAAEKRAAGRVGFHQAGGLVFGQGRTLVEDIGDYQKELKDDDVDLLRAFTAAWRAAAAEQKKFHATNHRLAPPGAAARGRFDVTSTFTSLFWTHPVRAPPFADAPRDDRSSTQWNGRGPREDCF